MQVSPDKAIIDVYNSQYHIFSLALSPYGDLMYIV